MSSYEFMSWKCAVIKFTSPTAQHLQCVNLRRFTKLYGSLEQMMSIANFMLCWTFYFKATVVVLTYFKKVYNLGNDVRTEGHKKVFNEFRRQT